MAPSDDRLIAEVLAPLVSKVEALHQLADQLALDITRAEQEMRKRLSRPVFPRKGKDR